jgi:hypothetical protein
MKHCLWFILILCATAQAQAPGLAVWPSPLVLRQKGDALLACLPAGAEPMLLRAASVGQLDGSWPPDEWAIVLEPKGTPVTLEAGGCIAYNEAPDGYAQAGGGKLLRPGETYGFLLQEVDDTGNATTGRFLGLFCVEQPTTGVKNFLAYVEHANGTTTYPRCGQYMGSPPASDGIRPPDTPDGLN